MVIGNERPVINTDRHVRKRYVALRDVWQRLNAATQIVAKQAECTALKNVKLRMQMQGGDLQVSHGTLGGFGVSLRLPLHPAHSLNTEQQNGQPQKEETSHADTVACG